MSCIVQWIPFRNHTMKQNGQQGLHLRENFWESLQQLPKGFCVWDVALEENLHTLEEQRSSRKLSRGYTLYAATLPTVLSQGKSAESQPVWIRSLWLWKIFISERVKNVHWIREEQI